MLDNGTQGTKKELGISAKENVATVDMFDQSAKKIETNKIRKKETKNDKIQCSYSWKYASRQRTTKINFLGDTMDDYEGDLLDLLEYFTE